MIGSNSCLHYIDLENDTEYDIDYLYKLSDIRSVVFSHENNKYYVFANRSKGFLGQYLYEFDESNLDENENLIPDILISQRSLLDNGDTKLNLIVSEGTNKLVLSFKSIYINTYNVLIIDLDTKQVDIRHESYHLWESSISGVLLANNEYAIISKEGLRVMQLRSKDARIIKDEKGHDWKLYPLESCTDLNLE